MQNKINQLNLAQKQKTTLILMVTSLIFTLCLPIYQLIPSEAQGIFTEPVAPSNLLSALLPLNLLSILVLFMLFRLGKASVTAVRQVMAGEPGKTYQFAIHVWAVQLYFLAQVVIANSYGTLCVPTIFPFVALFLSYFAHQVWKTEGEEPEEEEVAL